MEKIVIKKMVWEAPGNMDLGIHRTEGGPPLASVEDPFSGAVPSGIPSQSPN